MSRLQLNRQSGANPATPGPDAAHAFGARLARARAEMGRPRPNDDAPAGDGESLTERVRQQLSIQDMADDGRNSFHRQVLAHNREQPSERITNAEIERAVPDGMAGHTRAKTVAERTHDLLHDRGIHPDETRRPVGREGAPGGTGPVATTRQVAGVEDNPRVDQDPRTGVVVRGGNPFTGNFEYEVSTTPEPDSDNPPTNSNLREGSVSPVPGYTGSRGEDGRLGPFDTQGFDTGLLGRSTTEYPDPPGPATSADSTRTTIGTGGPVKGAVTETNVDAPNQTSQTNRVALEAGIGMPGNFTIGVGGFYEDRATARTDAEIAAEAVEPDIDRLNADYGEEVVSQAMRGLTGYDTIGRFTAEEGFAQTMAGESVPDLTRDIVDTMSDDLARERGLAEGTLSPGLVGTPDGRVDIGLVNPADRAELAGLDPDGLPAQTVDTIAPPEANPLRDAVATPVANLNRVDPAPAPAEVPTPEAKPVREVVAAVETVPERPEQLSPEDKQKQQARDDREADNDGGGDGNRGDSGSSFGGGAATGSRGADHDNDGRADGDTNGDGSRDQHDDSAGNDSTDRHGGSDN